MTHQEEAQEQSGAHRCPGNLARQLTQDLDPLREKLKNFMARPLATLIEQHGQEALQIFQRRFGGHLLLFAPLYVGNACQNDCAYCGFRRSARFRRKILSVAESVEQAWKLAQEGHRSIDLVTGEIPKQSFVDHLCGVIRAIREKTPIRSVNLNLGALTKDHYRRLHQAGASGYNIYQESYCQETYFQVHQSGPKRDMAWRLGAPRRALEAGFSGLGLGILLGLGPLQEELVRLCRHAQLLGREFPDARLGFSLPRLRQVDTACPFEAQAPVNDTSFIKALLFLRLAFPKAHLTVTTRESQPLRERLLALGVTKLSAGVSTAPGGYGKLVQENTAQFNIRDQRSLEEVRQRLAQLGIPVVLAQEDRSPA